VYCCGGGARIPGLTDVIGERLRIPVEVANPLQALEVKEDAFGPLNVDDVAPLLMQVVGLALRR
jgi:type IV pilus assembly protein PilM